MKKRLCIFTSALIVLSCFGDETPTGPATDATFAIYLLDDTTMTTFQAIEYELSELQLQGAPWLSIDDIDFYDFSTHCIYLKENFSSLFSSDTINVWRNVFGTPFVVVADGERCYLGSFYSLLSSWLPIGPRIEDIDCWQYPIDVIHINRAVGFNAADASAFYDVRNDIRIRNSLLSQNKLNAGLQIELDNVEVINQPDTSTVVYTFTITNKDVDDLYVPDPELMVNNLFHFYTNGVTFDNGHHYYSEYKSVTSPDPFYSWNIEWFTKIQSGHSIQRTVTLKGYPNIPVGSYYCWFKYSGPKKIERDNRMLSNGRLWLGEIESNVIIASVSQ